MPARLMWPLHGLRAVRGERAQIPVLAALCVALAILALVLPLWLILGTQSMDSRAAEGVARTCERLIRRGQLAPLGFVAGGLLIVWGATVVGTLVARLSRDIVSYVRLGRRLNAYAEEFEVFAGGQAVKIRVVPDQARLAFSLGMFRPRIYITRGLLAVLDARELQAVVLHELAHVRRRDPLVCWLVRVSTSSLWLPGASGFASRFAAISEMKADEVAASSEEDERALLGALLKTEATVNRGLACALTPEGARVLGEVRQPPKRASRPRVPMIAGLTVIGCLAVLAVVGLGDWQTYWACAQDVSGPASVA